MKNILSSELFYKAWKDVVYLNRDMLLPKWRDAKAFTTIIKGCEENLIQQVADKLGLSCYNKDYYSIDSILYSDEDLVPETPIGSSWFRQVKVAFEHENNFNKNLFQEVSHLLIIQSELKVIVTYPQDDIDFSNQTTSVMQYLHDIIKGTRQQSSLSENESFLMIFGYESNFVWEAYVYKTCNWKKL